MSIYNNLLEEQFIIIKISLSIRQCYDRLLSKISAIQNLARTLVINFSELKYSLQVAGWMAFVDNNLSKKA